MPYNLRKRKLVEPVEPVEVVKKARAQPKTKGKDKQIESKDEPIKSPDEQIESQDEPIKSKAKQPKTKAKQPKSKDEPIESQDEPIESQDEPVKTKAKQSKTKAKQPKTKDEPIESKEEPLESQDEPFESQDEPIESQDEPVKSKAKQPKTKAKQPKTKDEPIESKEEPLESQDEPFESQDEPIESQDEPVKSKVKQPKTKAKQPKTKDEPIESKEEPLESKEEQLESQDETIQNKDEPTKSKEVKTKSKDEPIKSKDEQIKSKDENNQLVFGSDTCGELGLKKIGCTRKNPIPVPLDAPVSQVVCGPMHTLSLTKSGSIYSYGCNDEGALGRVTDGDDELESTPTIIELEREVTKISTGDSHGAALTDKGEVFIWGNFRDEHGSVGLLPECNGQATYRPIPVMADKKFQDIASGSNHMLLLDVDGIVYSFGVGAQGQLGRLSSEQVGTGENPVDITAENRDLFLTPKVVSMKNVDPSREFICDAIFAGNFSSFATNTDKKKNRLAAWGLNNYYQLGYKGLKGQLIQYFPKRSTFTCSTSMINVACGQHHTIYLTKNGRVYASGRNEYGMLGIGNGMKDKKEICPASKVDAFDGPMTTICAGINTSFAVDDQGKLYAWGMNGPNLGVESGDDDLMEPTEVNKLAAYKVISVSSGSSFTAVIVEN